jgi:hypothetical protein
MTTLTVRPAGFGTWPHAEVRDWNLRLVSRIAIGAPLDVAPGRYYVSLSSPTAEDLVEIVEIEEGEDAVVLAVDELVAEDEEAMADGDEAPMVGAPAVEAAPPAEPALPWRIRLVSGRDGKPIAGAPIPSAVPAGDGELAVEGLGGNEGAQFAQLAVPGGRAHNVALPMWWSLRVRVTGEDVWARAVPPDDGYVDVLAAYLEAGLVREAADLGATAERLLQQKLANPIGATIGGYALLRMGETELMHNWPYNLSRWFPWLPDGAVIAGELALLQDDTKGAARQLEQAAERGVPLFAEGLSLLSRRVREGLVKSQAAKRIAALSPFAELGHLTVALPGSDPTTPGDTQQPLRAFPAGDGWHAFSGTEEE